MSELWRVEVVPVPDRSKYRHPPYWFPDDPLPLDPTPDPRGHDPRAAWHDRTHEEGER